MAYSFSHMVHSMHAKDVKLLMKQSSGKDMISFAGGMPNNDLFPLKEIEDIFHALPPDLKKLCFQYGPTAGYPPLIKALKSYLEKKSLPVEENKILITTGSLQAISIITQEFVNKGDIILTEKPCFVGALTVFETYGAKIIGIPVDENGIVIDELKAVLKKLPKKPKFLYVTPNFHNPAGIIYSLERKNELLETLAGKGILLLEDDAYSDLYFEQGDKHFKLPMKALNKSDVDVIYTGSFSKILGPGFRLGYMLASPDIFDKAETIKQALDACTSNFCQILAQQFLAQGALENYLVFLRKEYRMRKDLMIQSLEKHMPEGVDWHEPKGGFYIWVKLPAGIRSKNVFRESVKKGVVFVTGRTFDPKGKGDRFLRLSFANVPKNEIDKGIGILAEALKKTMTKRDKFNTIS
ncbi:aminotransferase-like domain-containing protein [Namhaeicola litoreus]|uniref:PLP-dependent aminotransferase family protein n=1 Tax=Namhaeicola litoreus TaxID=1052145 RepID=A0ABW3Y2X4_9FLAO